MIKTKGSNVSPAEVELELQALPEVDTAYVFGLPDPALGERVVAAVVARPGMVLDFADLQAQLKARLSGFKVPRQFVEIALDDIPMLPSNKVARRALQALVAERLG
jgi:acyl-CoA synthetase (AMP-forming)/AMP-acid ligase II